MNQKSRNVMSAAIVVAVLVGAYAAGTTAQEKPEKWHKGLPRQHKSKYLVHDLSRPHPKVVTPGKNVGQAPSDAIVLFDGSNLDAWKGRGGPSQWTVRDGYMELANKGDMQTKQEFGDCQFHIEWASPSEPQGVSQVRGNSGVWFMGMFEVQILDNYNNKTYPDGYAAGVYGQHPPMTNAARKPGEWQSYDIIFRAPRYKKGEDGNDVITEPGRVTVMHNGVLTVHNAEIFGQTAWRSQAKYPKKMRSKGPIRLQDHGDRQKVRFRNVWIRPIDLSPTE